MISNARDKQKGGWADPGNVSQLHAELMERKTFTLRGGFDQREGVRNWDYLKDAIHFDPETLAPLNPRGRTGIRGRGLLGKWGPNHAADPIVTRWHQAEDEYGNPVGEPRLQMVAIKRKDTGDFAIPGGMVDAGESVSLTLRREFTEEAG